MAGRLEGRVAVVTGGASGIGAATVRRFVEEGASVVVADLQRELEALRKLQSLARLHQQLRRCQSGQGLGGGGVKSAKSDITGTGRMRLLRGLQRLAAGGADEGSRAALPRFRQRTILLAQMHAIEACGCYLSGRAIVDQQRHAAITAEDLQLQGIAMPHGSVIELVSVLHQHRAAVDGLPHRAQQGAGIATNRGRSDGIETAGWQLHQAAPDAIRRGTQRP